MKTETRASEFNPDRIIAELQQLAKDWEKGDLRNYRVTKSPIQDSNPVQSVTKR